MGRFVDLLEAVQCTLYSRVGRFVDLLEAVHCTVGVGLLPGNDLLEAVHCTLYSVECATIGNMKAHSFKPFQIKNCHLNMVKLGKQHLEEPGYTVFSHSNSSQTKLFI